MGTNRLMTIFMFVAVFSLLTTSLSYNPQEAYATTHLIYADSVIASDIKHSVPGRTTTSEALDEEDSFGVIKFVSLGSGGFITLGFSQPVGGTLSVFEATFGGWALETARVEVYDGTWTTIGTASNQRGDVSPLVESKFSIGVDIGCVTMVRITDTSPVPDDNDNRASPDYFDVDAVGFTEECIPPAEVCDDDVMILFAGQHIDAGFVTINDDGTNLTVTIQTENGWELTESHVHVGDELTDFPLTKKGSPKVGHFEFSESHDPGTTEFTYTIPLPDDVDKDGIIIAVHAVVVQVEGEVIVAEETAWKFGVDRFVEKGNWATYNIYDICDEIPSQDVCIEPPTEMISWWPGDDNADDIQDGNDGTLNGATFAEGKVGQAFSFDGNNDSVDMGNVLDFGTGTFSVDAWVQTETTGNSKKVVGTFLSGNPGWEFSIRDNGKLIVFLNDGVITGLQSVSTESVNDGQFHHIAATVNRATNDINLYIDGVETNYDVDSLINGGFSSGTDISSDIIFSMGKRTDGNVPFKGLMDEVEIFDGVITAENIKDIFDADSAGKCKVA